MDFEFCQNSELGINEDLEHMKTVVTNEYTVVGILEKLDDTLDLLEAKVPQFFKGIKDIYYRKRNTSISFSILFAFFVSNLFVCFFFALTVAARPTDVPEPEIPQVSTQILSEMKARYAPEIEFYQFVNDHFEKEIKSLRARS